MNRVQNIGLGVIWIGGFLGGLAVSLTSAEIKARKDYDLKLDSVKRAYEEALTIRSAYEVHVHNSSNSHKPVEEVEIPEVVLAEPTVEPEESEQVSVNPYHTAIEAAATPIETFVSGEENQFGIAYIEDEDYLDEGDGRFKGRIDIIMNEDTPFFFMEGDPIDDWEKRIGPSILVDFFKLVPPGTDPVLYVRNHRTGEDYEVVQVMP